MHYDVIYLINLSLPLLASRLWCLYHLLTIRQTDGLIRWSKPSSIMDPPSSLAWITLSFLVSTPPAARNRSWARSSSQQKAPCSATLGFVPMNQLAHVARQKSLLLNSYIFLTSSELLLCYVNFFVDNMGTVYSSHLEAQRLTITKVKQMQRNCISGHLWLLSTCAQQIRYEISWN